MSPLERVVALCAAGHRGTATPAELTAAARIAGWMRDLGAVSVSEERFRNATSFGAIFFVHFAALFVSATLGGWSPAAGLAVGALGLASLVGELTLRWSWLGRLVPRGTSANVVGRIPAAGAPLQTVVLAAHHDTQKPGVIFREGVQRLAQRWERAPDAASGSPFVLPVAIATGQCLLLAVNALGGDLPAWLLLFPGAAAFLGMVLVGEWAAQRTFIQGANDNATGVAAILQLGAELARSPLAHTELILLSSGAEEAGCGGARAFLERHPELSRATTLFVVVDTVGAGALRYVTDEHALRRAPSDPELLGHLAALAAEPAHAGLAPYSLGLFTDSSAFLAGGRRSVALIGWDAEWYARNYHQPGDRAENVDGAAIERAIDLLRALLRRLDARPPAPMGP